MNDQPVERRLVQLVGLIVLAVSVAACGSSPMSTPAPAASAESSGRPIPPATGEQSTNGPESSAGESGESGEFTLALGDGPFNLGDPTIGLTELSDYVATLVITFNGTRAGSPSNVKTTTTMTASPTGRQLTIERGTDGPSTYLAEVGGIAYAKDDGAACSTRSIDETNTLAASYEPAAQLAMLGGADEAGSDAVSGIATHHYTFDSQSVVMLGVESASGELWVADQGDYVVRYVLSTDLGPDFIGDDTTGTRELRYELSLPDESAAIELPADCATPVDAPLLSDAADVLSRPDFLSYTTATSLEDAAAFYTDQLTARGWEPADTTSVGDTTAVLAFAKDDSNLTVVMRGGTEEVKVTVVTTGKPAP